MVGIGIIYGDSNGGKSTFLKLLSKMMCGVEVPSYASVLTYFDYFGDKTIGRNANNKIISAWRNEPKQFTADRKKNKLIYMYPENGHRYELKYICDELPPSLKPQLLSRSIVMDLEEAEKFFGIEFKRKLFGR